MELTVYSRSNNHELWLKMRSLIPENVECIEIDNFNDWQDASKYLYHIIDNAKTKFIVNIDIDAFVLNWNAVNNLANVMRTQGYTHAGMRDNKKTCYHRNGFEDCMNPFFNVFNVELIQKLKPSTVWDYVENSELNPIEPFYPFFQFLHKNGRGFYLPTKMLRDNIGCTLGLPYAPEKSIVTHTWYSREYNHDESVKSRINNIFENSKCHARLIKENWL